MIGGSPARVAAVMNGQLDFTMVTEPGKIEAERAGLKVIIDMAKLDIPFPVYLRGNDRADDRRATRESHGFCQSHG
jgi:hypothetical protein